VAEDQVLDAPATPAVDVTALQNEIATLRQQSATLLDEKKKLQLQYKDIDPEKIRTMMSHFETSEESRLMAEGKIDEVISRRVAKREESVAQQIADAQAEVTRAKEYATRFNAKLLQGELRTAFPTDVHQSMSVPLLRELEQLFTLDEEGNVVPKDGAMGKSGKALYAPKEAIEDLRGQYPGFFVNGNSGSSSFQGSGKGGSKTISREKFEATPLHLRHEIIASGIQVVDR